MMTTLTRNHATLALEVKSHIEADALVHRVLDTLHRPKASL
jgi:hypothetical protein